MALKRTARRRERRGSDRTDARLSMRVEGGHEQGQPAQIVTESQNISASGIYCLSSHYLAPLSKVSLTIVLPKFPGARTSQELVKCEGIVVRCDQRSGRKLEAPYELACMFAALEPALRERIEEFVAWRNLQALRAALRPTPRRAAARTPALAAARRSPAARARTARGARRRAR